MNVETFGAGFLENLINGLTLLVAKLLNDGSFERLTKDPPERFLATAHWITSGIVIVGLLIAWAILRWAICGPLNRKAGGDETSLALWISRAVKGPVLLLLAIFGIYCAIIPLLAPFAPESLPKVILAKLLDVGLFIVVIWAFQLATKYFEAHLVIWTQRTKSKVDDLLLPHLLQSARLLIPALAIIFALPLMDIPERFDGMVRKASSITIIVVTAWLLWRTAGVGEKIALGYFDFTAKDDLQARKVLTHIRILKKVFLFLICLFALASTLMLFEEVRRLGTSLLASAGVVGIIIGFAAQRTIANLFAGFQISITQPIRIGDAVQIEGEFGHIEEITLTYVVVKVWDLRRLIVPINQFIEKPFQNWTRTSSAIMGSAFLFLDYTAPLQEIRAEFKRIVEASPFWDKKVCVLHVTDANDHAIQVRLLVSSANSGDNFELRCEVREKLLQFIRQRFPNSLPRRRTSVDASASGEAEAGAALAQLPPSNPQTT